MVITDNSSSSSIAAAVGEGEGGDTLNCIML